MCLVVVNYGTVFLLLCVPINKAQKGLQVYNCTTERKNSLLCSIIEGPLITGEWL